MTNRPVNSRVIVYTHNERGQDMIHIGKAKGALLLTLVALTIGCLMLAPSWPGTWVLVMVAGSWAALGGRRGVGP